MFVLLIIWVSLILFEGNTFNFIGYLKLLNQIKNNNNSMYWNALQETINYKIQSGMSKFDLELLWNARWEWIDQTKVNIIDIQNDHFILKLENHDKGECYDLSFGYIFSLTHLVLCRDVKFGIQIGSDWPQMGQIWDFLRSVSDAHWLTSVLSHTP